MKITKRAIFLLLCGVIVLALIPIASATTTTTEFGNIADAADDYLNAPDTKFNISSQGLLESSLLGDPYVLSIRKHEHFLNGHIPGAVNMAAASLFQPENMDKLPKNRTIYVYCYTGHTGSQTAALLNLNGYKAVNVKWGMMGWTKDPDVVVASFFTDPATDLPVEARINEPSATYELPQVETDAANEAEAIRLASYNYVSDGFKNISAGDVHELISDDDANNDPVIVSVRSPEDYAKGHIPGAINIPLKDIARGENLQKLNPDKKIVVYCYTGRTASQATAILNALGYDAWNLKWGISGWTTDPEVAPYRFNLDSSADYPLARTAVSQVKDPITAADDYLNAPDTKFNISSQGLLESSLLGDPYILSIRRHEHFLNGHIPGAVNMAAASLFQPENMDKLPKNKTIYVYCYTGHTGSQTAALLNLNGYKAVNVKWGMMGWTKDPDVVVASFFTDPATDLPVETKVNEPSATYELPQVETDATNEAEAIRLASYNYVSDGFKNISAGDVHELISDDDANNDPVIVSVRSPEDYAKGHIPGAINIPLKEIARGENLQKLNPDKKIVVYCYTGRTASQATAILNALGYDAWNLKWGISGWTADPEVAPYRFNLDTSADYPVQTGEVEIPESPESPTTPEAPPAEEEAPSGPCG